MSNPQENDKAAQFAKNAVVPALLVGAGAYYYLTGRGATATKLAHQLVSKVLGDATARKPEDTRQEELDLH